MPICVIIQSLKEITHDGKGGFLMKKYVSILLVLMLMLNCVPTLAETWICPECSQENSGNFCGHCGIARSDIWACLNCGQTNTTTFCTNCGTKQPEVATETPKEPLSEPLDYDAVSAELNNYFQNKVTVTVIGTITTTVDGESREIGKYYEGVIKDIEKNVAAEFQIQGRSIRFKFRQDGAVSGNSLKKAQAWAKENRRTDPDASVKEINSYFDGTDFYCVLDTEISAAEWEDGLPAALASQVFDIAEQLLRDLAKLNAEALPAATPKPTPKPTATPKPKAKDDIPDLAASVQLRPLMLGQRDKQRSGDYNSNYLFYTYDYYGGFIKESDVNAYLKLIEDKYDFIEINRTDETIWASAYKTYFFRYVGSKQVSPLMVGDKKKYRGEYNLQVRVSNRGDSDHCSITVSFAPELTYAGSYAEQGRWFNGSDQINVLPDPVPVFTPAPVPTSKPLPQPCPKCHGNKQVQCSQCSGSGGKYIYDNSTRSTGRTWERCFKCKGTGNVPCAYCGGDGKIKD